jgi:MFS family permease
MFFRRPQFLRRSERATLSYAYSGEFGRGIFAALCMEFALVVAIMHFKIPKTGTLIWLLSAAGFIGMLISLFGTSFTNSHRKKSIVFSLEIVSRLFAILAAFSTTGVWFVVAMSAGIAANSVNIPLVSGIYSSNFSTQTRGQAVSRLQAVFTGSVAVAVGLTAWIIKPNLDFFRHILVGVSIVSLALSWYAYRLPEPRSTGNGKTGFPLREFFMVFRRDPAFLYIEVFWFIVGLCNLCLIPLCVLHLEENGFGATQVLLATTATRYVTQIFIVGMWGMLIYRINFAYYRMVISVLFICGILIFFHSSTFSAAALGMFVWGAGIAGGSLSWRLVATFFTTNDRVPLYMCAHSFLCGVRGIIGPFIALNLKAAYGPTAVPHLCVGALGLSILMLIPLAKILEGRRHLVQPGKTQKAAA